jgi:hypothetical protein
MSVLAPIEATLSAVRYRSIDPRGQIQAVDLVTDVVVSGLGNAHVFVPASNCIQAIPLPTKGFGNEKAAPIAPIFDHLTKVPAPY